MDGESGETNSIAADTEAEIAFWIMKFRGDIAVGRGENNFRQ